MRQLVIDNPVINSAFLEPGKHFKFTDDGITDEIVESRRPSAYFIPVAQPKKKGKQLELGTEWTDDRRRENDYINEVRAAVGDWRRRDSTISSVMPSSVNLKCLPGSRNAELMTGFSMTS